jgi:recombination protein RecA
MQIRVAEDKSCLTADASTTDFMFSMSASVLQLPELRLVTAERLDADAREAPVGWGLEAVIGRLAELSGPPGAPLLTVATALVLEAQGREEPTAWITPRDACFYPPDLAESGVDLEALVVVRVPTAADGPRAADKLLRSGAFGLVVVDLRGTELVPGPLLTRLSGLVQRHGAALVLLTEKAASLPSLGSLIAVRVEVSRHRQGRGRFRCEVSVLKDKRHGPGHAMGWERRGPPGC